MTYGGEQHSDGIKVRTWPSVKLFLELSGHFAFLAFDDRPKTADVAAPRIPVGPMVACFGTYKVNEDARTLTYYIATSSTTTFNGITRGQKVTLSGASLSTIGTLVKTPKGDIVPIDEWKRAK